jgi:hypothetical protein
MTNIPPPIIRQRGGGGGRKPKVNIYDPKSELKANIIAKEKFIELEKERIRKCDLHVQYHHLDALKRRLES